MKTNSVTGSRVKPCVVTPTQYRDMVRGKRFIYHIRASTEKGSFINKTLCGGIVKSVIPITYTKMHNAYGPGKLCSFCRDRSLEHFD